MPAVTEFVMLDRTSPVPLYFQVAEQLERAVLDGRVAPGERLDNEIAMANDLGLSRPTMRQAIQVLVDKGMLVRKRGVGTQVVQGRINRSVELTSLYDDLAAAGKQPRTELLSLERKPADEELASELQVPPGTPVWDLRRLRLAGDQPLALMHNVIPASIAPLDEVDLSATGLYDFLRQRGVTLRVAKQRIGARRATTNESALLDEPRNAPLLTMTRTAYDSAGRTVEFGNHAYRPDLYAFELTLVDR